MVAAREKDPTIEAEDFQVEKYLIRQVSDLLTGKSGGEVEVASYTILEDGVPRCTMPEEIELEKRQKISVADYQWFHAAGRVVYTLGLELHDVLGGLREELKKQKWPSGGEIKEDGEGNQWLEQTTKELIWPIRPERLRAQLSFLETKVEGELVIVGTQKVFINKAGEENSWQILVRRKSAR